MDFTLEAARSYAKEMQVKFRLQDWNIEVEWFSENPEDKCGQIEWTIWDKEVVILLSEGMDEELSKWTIRHELGHLLLEGHRECGDKRYDPHYEFGLDMLTKFIE